MSLSVCCPTGDPGPRVHAILEPLRAVADEVVVAADSRTSAADLGWYDTVADRLVTFEYPGNVERVYAWLHAQCSCDWILLIEGDECASPALIERLPELTNQRQVNQWFIPRRWLYPDPEHWLDESPWWPDLSNRLVRNDGALFFPGLQHTDPLRVDPAGFVEEPMYHLAALQPVEERRAKMQRYEGSAPNLLIGGALPVNETYYLPEDASRRPPVPVPEQDRAAVTAVVNGTAGEPPPPRTDVEHVPLSETDRLYASRPFSPHGYRARIELLERDMSFAPGEQRGVLLRLSNDGDEQWPWGLERSPHIHLSYESWDEPAAAWVESDVITPLPHALEPGQTAIAPLTVIAPSEPGRHRIRVDLRHAGHRPFGSALEIELLVG
jgi:hypothetical protein